MRRPIREAPRILFLTSTRAGEGKRFTALNLAAAYAQTGKKVLLIDGDLRKASLSAFYGGKNARGLVHLLMNPQVSPIPSRKSGKRFPGFDLVTAGPVPPNPVALLTQGRLEELLRYWRARYDRIILDGCPYEAVADASPHGAPCDLVLWRHQMRHDREAVRPRHPGLDGQGRISVPELSQCGRSQKFLFSLLRRVFRN